MGHGPHSCSSPNPNDIFLRFYLPRCNSVTHAVGAHLLASSWDRCCTERNERRRACRWRHMSGSKAAPGAAVGGKAARACDSCLRRRARWYCAADDAFLCQGCDASVHSANPLARRHERLRLRPTSLPRHAALEAGAASTSASEKRQQVAPGWSKRKARTRRPQVKSVGQLLSRKLIVVPEVTVDSSSDERKAEEEEEEEEELLYRVPNFDRALAELCSPPPIDDPAAGAPCSREDADGTVEHTKTPVVAESPVQQLPDSFPGFGPTDAELREFAADMEALLGQGLNNGNELDESFYMESLGLMTPAGDGGRVKMEPGSSVISHIEGSLSRGPAELKPEESAEVLDIDFHRSSPTVTDHDEDSFERKASASNGVAADSQFLKRSLDLRLNYETIIESWGSSPWTGGQRPNVQIDDFWPHAHHSVRFLLANLRCSSIVRACGSDYCSCNCVFMVLLRGAGRVDGRGRTAGWGGVDAAAGDHGRRAGGAGVAVPGEAADEAVRQEDTVRGAEAERGEAAADEGPVRQAAGRRRNCRRALRRHLAELAGHAASVLPCVSRSLHLQTAARRSCEASRARHEITDSSEIQNLSKLF
ncbi:zinc finger protein CONSTANS-LIKE 16-like isoform X1 [Panicum miliaceum]|uniref:Zinc finger protein CONSTANS-LIKE 16-like isoform X1 n=1 Tax=Panicum miliaceum TaxID=4540 RepID=A0A3L6RN14_PANMI|nr:zinc finger protein CONSTANS-LIKE 16-like isoform X1 [Panicum miliaceum]